MQLNGQKGRQRFVSGNQIRKTQCRMACGGEATTGVPVRAAAEHGSGAGGTTGVVYSAFKITAGTVSVDTWSLC